ncbi:MAG: ferritin family protein [Candidatus Riflebacteria bacterium]|nr:ferritin family protein [Candidatus Riflebacteria bacterium]
MTIQLDACDVFKAAIMLEERGVGFYADAAVKFSGHARNLLMQLSEMEKGHAQIFRNILAGLAAVDVVADDSDGEESAAFLQALTSDRIITDACRPDENDSYDTVLEKAMLIEKNSVFFYTTVKEIVQGKMAVGAVEKILQEELTHFKMLNDALIDWRRRNKRGRSRTDE